MKGLAWGFAYACLVLAFLIATNSAWANSTLVFFKENGNLAIAVSTMLGPVFAASVAVIVASIEWRAWRPKQLAIKAQEPAEDLWLKANAFFREIKMLARPPSLRDDSDFVSYPQEEFAFFVERNAPKLKVLSEKYDELILQTRKLILLEASAADIRRLELAGSFFEEASDASDWLVFCKELQKDITGDEKNFMSDSSFESTHRKIKAISPVDNTEIEEAMKTIFRVAESAMSLKGGNQ